MTKQSASITAEKPKVETLTFDLNADALAAVSMARGTSETRYYLTGVYIMPWRTDGVGGVMMVATDGHILATYFDAEGSASRSAIITGDFQSSKLRTAKGERADRRLRCDGDIGRVFSIPKRQNLPQAVALCLVGEIDGTFPDWEKVIPKPSKTAFASDFFSWSHLVLSRVCRIAERINGASQHVMNARQDDKGSAALFTFGRGCPLAVVAMPTRSDEHPDGSTAAEALTGESVASVSNQGPELFGGAA